MCICSKWVGWMTQPAHVIIVWCRHFTLHNGHVRMPTERQSRLKDKWRALLSRSWRNRRALELPGVEACRGSSLPERSWELPGSSFRRSGQLLGSSLSCSEGGLVSCLEGGLVSCSEAGSVSCSEGGLVSCSEGGLEAARKAVW